MSTWFADLRLRQKFAVALGGGSLACLVAVGLQQAIVHRAVAQAARLERHEFPATVHALTLQVQITTLQRDVRQTVLAGTREALDRWREEHGGARALMAARLDSLRTALGDTADRPQLAALESSVGAYLQLLDAISAPLEAGRTAEARRVILRDASREIVRTVNAALDATVAAQRGGVHAQNQQVETAIGRASWGLLAYVLLILLGAVVMHRLLSRELADIVDTISARCQQLTSVCVIGLNEALTAMAAGDLSRLPVPKTKPLGYDRRDELGDLARTVDTMIANAQASIAAYAAAREAVHRVAAAARDLAEAGQHGRLDQRVDAGEHAGSFRELVTAMNASVDAFVSPLHEASAILGRLAAGDLSATMTGEYRGEHARLARDVNDTVAALRGLLGDMQRQIGAAERGELASRLDASRYPGSFGDLVRQINAMLDAVVAPLTEAITALSAVAEGDLTVTMQGRYAGDLDVLATAVNRTVHDLRGHLAEIAEGARVLSGAAEEMASVSASLNGSAHETASQTQSVSAAAEQISANVQTVAAATEEMSASIREISKNAGEAARVAGGAAQVAHRTNASVAELGEAGAEIEQVVKLITAIAEQTNLLALNATIEAARAGEAGRGFAVVASSVKELAKQTTQATDGVRRKVEAIQNGTADVVESIREISAVIGHVNDLQNAIAGAVEEQSATTREMARNVGEAASGCRDIALGIGAVALGVGRTTTGTSAIDGTVAEVRQLAASLRELAGRFRTGASTSHPAARARLVATT